MFAFGKIITYESCDGYYNSNNVYITYQLCPLGFKCCGTCNARRCCTSPQSYLNQIGCANGINTINNNNGDKTNQIFISILIFALILVVLCIIGFIIRILDKMKTRRRSHRRHRRRGHSPHPIVSYRDHQTGVFSISLNNNNSRVNGAPPPYTPPSVTITSEQEDDQRPPSYEEAQINRQESEPKY